MRTSCAIGAVAGRYRSAGAAAASADLLKQGKEPLGEFFAFDRDNTDGQVFKPLPPNIGISLSLSPPSAGVAPALKLKSKVAATLDTPVK